MCLNWTTRFKKIKILRKFRLRIWSKGRSLNWKFGIIWNEQLRQKTSFKSLAEFIHELKLSDPLLLYECRSKFKQKSLFRLKMIRFQFKSIVFLINRGSTKRKNKILSRERSKDSKNSSLFEFTVDSLYVYLENNQLLKIFQKDC